MTADILEVIVDLQVQTSNGATYPVVMVTLPACVASSLEILTYNPTSMCIVPSDNGDNLTLRVHDQRVADLDDRNGNLETFKQLLDAGHMFALTLTACSESKDSTLYILTRTMLAENVTGRVVSNTGPQKMLYEEALQGNEDSPESHCTGRSFRTAVAIAVAMRSEDQEHLRLVN